MSEDRQHQCDCHPNPASGQNARRVVCVGEMKDMGAGRGAGYGGGGVGGWCFGRLA